MLVKLFFLTLLTVSNCQPLDPDNHRKDCTTEDFVSIEGSGSSAPIDLTVELPDPKLFIECGPEDKCSDSSKDDTIEDSVSNEGSGSSAPIDLTVESPEPKLFIECRPEDKCSDSSTDDTIKDFVSIETSASSEPIDPKTRKAIDCPSNKTYTSCNSSACCCCSTNITVNNMFINVTNSFISSFLLPNLKSYNSSACCGSTNITINNTLTNISNSTIIVTPNPSVE